ncbi:NAD(P)/FAD-dependent oxidoreductase [Burkholderia ubonensis]|uniref:FAD-dependent oxidoreductase n=1 Tax=Burkholderia ubonensis TaxID=101571 RepID=A0A107FTE6_9BURK|nr:FAD-dependent oxidoreductase [Burkholderia ubonensis]AOK62359.1 FAD-dependent oxidoreductase [Burkholderia ubonensis]KVS40528.1 FAD-dependent oxidoreductase [Burkholderia ubonensis]KVS51144.1 FAD-dependent oxidoreductase [Burkholderia ubonensis]KVS76149.1 FAD-dependent oxidoreductase [Burkholderia ubonensis]KVS78387.1 FAD-dependent oxidoreductase [Burkholderia ubonensis]
MSEHRHYDVAIVGGGLVGASAALALTKRGLSVGLFERRDCGAQASGVNYGGVRCQGRPAEQLPLALRARRIWDRLPELIGIDGEFVVSGHLRLARSDADLDALDAYATLAGEHGLPLRMITGDAFRRRYPWLGRAALGGSLCATDGHANPRLVSPAFARAARAAGADVFEHTPVDDVGHDGARFRLRAAGREASATWLINSAGAWANAIAERFGEAAPMQPIYPNMWVTEPLPPFVAHNLGVYGGGVYARQVARGNCVIGGGRGRGDGEFGQPSVDTTRAVMRDACALLPALRNALVIRTWSGVEGCTPDHNPILGVSRTTPRLLHAFGFSGGGFLLAPGVGDVLADLVTTGETATPLDAFAVDRFAPRAAPSDFPPHEETHR